MKGLLFFNTLYYFSKLNTHSRSERKQTLQTIKLRTTRAATHMKSVRSVSLAQGMSNVWYEQIGIIFGTVKTYTNTLNIKLE